MTARPFIVVIDDDLSIGKALRRLLQFAQMDVETYPSGETFLLAALHREPDCLVLDVRMPGMTGPELRDRLLDDGRSVPVVFITAHDPAIHLLRGPAGRGAAVLRKPFEEQALLDAIGSAIARRGMA